MEISLKADEKLLFSLRELYRLYGYHSFRMSKFEKYELYAGNKDFLVSDRVITFNDTTGELLALKPDVTLSIVRNASFVPGCKQKLYYHENVYRPAGSSRQFREIMQCGLECIGDLDNYDVYEVLHLAAESLRAISEQSVLSVSHLGILKSLFACLGAGEQEQSEMLKLTAARNEHELAELFCQNGWNLERLQDLRALLGLSCSLMELPGKLESLQLDWLDASVWRELSELSSLCEAEDDRLCFDLSVINDIHYYNGIVFQGFVQGVAEKVISGGPMMGMALSSLDVPCTKTFSSLLCFTKDQVKACQPGPCIRCGRCVDVCPAGLMPTRLSEVADHGDFALFDELGGCECVECGCCSYICPAKRRLTQSMKTGRREALALRRKKKA